MLRYEEDKQMQKHQNKAFTQDKRYTQDLPCMHLDPGVNRLRFNITSVHQTDSWPVAPDIVFPICVILQRWERVSKSAKSTV